MALLPPPQHSKAWQNSGLQLGNIWQHLAASGNKGCSMSAHYTNTTEVVPEGYCVVFSGSKQSPGRGQHRL